MMDRRRFLSAAGLGALANCRGGGGDQIRVSVGPYLYLCPLYLAAERGYFGDTGLRVKLVETPRGAQAIPLLAGGAVDVSFSAMTPALINAVSRGAAVRVVAAQDYTTPNCPGIGELLVRQSSYPGGLPDLRQLRGKRIAVVGMAGLHEFCLDRILAAGGLSADDVEEVILPTPDAVTAVLNGQVDAMVAPDHFGKDPGLVTPKLMAVAGLTAVLPGFAYTYIMFGSRRLERDRDVGARFLEATFRGAREYLAGATPRYLEDFARSTGMDPEVARGLCRDTAAPSGAVAAESIQIFIDWAARKGYCPRPVKAEALVDRRFLARLSG